MRMYHSSLTRSPAVFREEPDRTAEISPLGSPCRPPASSWSTSYFGTSAPYGRTQ